MSPLQSARQAAGMTQRDVAQLLQMTQANYSKIERGTVDLRARDALTLCRALKINLETLMNGVGK